MMVSAPNGSCDSWNIIKFWRQWHLWVSSGHCPCHKTDSLGHLGLILVNIAAPFLRQQNGLWKERKLWFSCCLPLPLELVCCVHFLLVCNKSPFIYQLKQVCYYLIVPQTRSLSGLNWVHCSGSPKAETKVYARMGWKLWGRICFQVCSCSRNPVSCNCRTEVQVAGCWPGFTLSSQMPFSGPCPKLSFSLMGNLPHVEFLSCLETLCLSLLLRDRDNALFLKKSND